MTELKNLLNLCKCSVTVTVNPHRDVYLSARKWLAQKIDRQGDDELLATAEVMNEMMLRDTIIEIHFYPETPIGFYVVYHYDLDSAIKEAIAILEAIWLSRL